MGKLTSAAKALGVRRTVKVDFGEYVTQSTPDLEVFSKKRSLYPNPDLHWSQHWPKAAENKADAKTLAASKQAQEQWSRLQFPAAAGCQHMPHANGWAKRIGLRIDTRSIQFDGDECKMEPDQCHKTPELTYPEGGVGGQLGRLVEQLQLSLTTEVLVTPTQEGLPAWTSRQQCGTDRGWVCLFNMTSCPLQIEFTRKKNEAIHSTSMEELPKSAQLVGCEAYGSCQTRTWLKAEALGWLFNHLQPHISKQVDTMRQAAVTALREFKAKGHTVIGMQIRKGDSCLVRGACIPDKQYHAAAQRMRKLYGADVIYLATDSLASSAACRHWTGFKCIVMNSELRSAIDGDQAEIHERQDINHVDIALFAIADLRTLQEFGDVFVGTHSSDFSEDAHALIRQRKGWNVPFIYMNVKTQIGKATHTLDT